jgi:large subunit ribosomal protein L15
MPLARKIPKRGFNNSAFRRDVAVVNLGDIESRFSVGDLVDLSALVSRSLVRGGAKSVKVLATGILTKALSFRVCALSDAARRKVVEVGGNVI